MALRAGGCHSARLHSSRQQAPRYKQTPRQGCGITRPVSRAHTAHAVEAVGTGPSVPPHPHPPPPSLHLFIADPHQIHRSRRCINPDHIAILHLHTHARTQGGNQEDPELASPVQRGRPGHMDPGGTACGCPCRGGGWGVCVQAGLSMGVCARQGLNP